MTFLLTPSESLLLEMQPKSGLEHWRLRCSKHLSTHRLIQVEATAQLFPSAAELWASIMMFYSVLWNLMHFLWCCAEITLVPQCAQIVDTLQSHFLLWIGVIFHAKLPNICSRAETNDISLLINPSVNLAISLLICQLLKKQLLRAGAEVFSNIGPHSRICAQKCSDSLHQVTVCA